jgi:uncharacterized membrane protein YdjX (TVP38/TMEM64 family)
MKIGRKRVLITIGVIAVVVVGLVLNPATVLDRAQSVLNSPWFPVVLVGLYVVRPFLGWPITALSALVGYKYGILLGVPIALLGAVGSTFIPYVIMRYVDEDVGWLGWIADESGEYFSETGDLRGTIAARVAPMPAEATSLAAGAADVKPSAYVVGTVVGELPWAFAAVTIGHSMYRLSLENVSYSPWLIVATLVAALILVAGPAHRLVKQYTDDDENGTNLST